MEKLFGALVTLAEAATKYFEAKTANEISGGARKVPAPQIPAPAPAPQAAPEKSPQAPTEPAPKKEKKAKPAAAPAPKEEKAPEAPSANPLGDTGSAPVDPLGDTGSAPVDPFGDTGAAVPQAPEKKEEKPAPAQTPAKAMTETESYDTLVKTMGNYLKLHKNEADGGEAARAEMRKVLVDQFKVAKIADLTHDQRLQAIPVFEKMVAAKAKK